MLSNDKENELLDRIAREDFPAANAPVRTARQIAESVRRLPIHEHFRLEQAAAIAQSEAAHGMLIEFVFRECSLQLATNFMRDWADAQPTRYAHEMRYLFDVTAIAKPPCGTAADNAWPLEAVGEELRVEWTGLEVRFGGRVLVEYRTVEL